MTLNFAQPEIAQDLSNQLDTTRNDFTKLARNQSQLTDQMRRFAQRLPDELRSDFASLIIKQNKIDKDMRTVSAQLRDINQNFEKHMPKRPPPQKLPKELTYNVVTQHYVLFRNRPSTSLYYYKTASLIRKCGLYFEYRNNTHTWGQAQL